MGRRYARTSTGRFAFTGGRKRRSKGGKKAGRSGSRGDNLLTVSKGGKVRKGTGGDIKKIQSANRRGVPVISSSIRGSGGASFVSSKSLAGRTKAGAKATKSGAKNIGKGRAPGSSGYIIQG